MGFKKVSYGGKEGRFKIRVEDVDGATVGTWTIMWSDLFKWAENMRRKYGIKKKEKDLDWAM